MPYVLLERKLDLSLLSAPISQNQSFSTSLEIAVRLMRNQWKKLNEIFENIYGSNSPSLIAAQVLPEEKEKFLYHFAKNAFFLDRSITWTDNNQQVAHEKMVCVCDILKELDQKISNYHLNREREYNVLFSLVTMENES